MQPSNIPVDFGLNKRDKCLYIRYEYWNVLNFYFLLPIIIRKADIHGEGTNLHGNLKDNFECFFMAVLDY